MGNNVECCAGSRNGGQTLDIGRAGGVLDARRAQTTGALWERVLREMSVNTRDLVMRALKRVESGQMSEDQAGPWMAERVKELTMLTDEVLSELWSKCEFLVFDDSTTSARRHC